MREWKVVADFNKYLVSNDGCIKSINTGKELKHAYTYNGYHRVTLYKQVGEKLIRKTVMVHRMVAKAFVPYIEGKTQINHKDGNKNNNSLENLELRCPNCHYFTDTYKTKNWSTQNNESAE